MEARKKTGLAATIAIIVAVFSWLATFTGQPFWGMILAVISIPIGLIGLVMAASPRVTGGLLSILAIALGLLGIGLSVLGMVGVILF